MPLKLTDYFNHLLVRAETAMTYLYSMSCRDQNQKTNRKKHQDQKMFTYIIMNSWNLKLLNLFVSEVKRESELVFVFRKIYGMHGLQSQIFVTP